MNDSILMKRFEIVIGVGHLNHLMELLERSGVCGYTVLKNAGGLGSQGIRNPDDVLITDENAVIILACKEEQAQILLNELRPAMKSFSGMCLISDCYA
ncbi:transcriptional regulator [Nitrosomonas sp.]|uniref:P-II family nitrogen regulator n=1 Tax=Nitrosomonas sp. TaxID=42353 RepID=UPI0025DF27AD|nr:transcriptional regulator [Nitrosomonas sp.]MBY0485114.1 transcriptional regulator [Nitrosomonas sp.]